MVSVYDPDNEPKFPPFTSIQVPMSRRGLSINKTAKAHLISSIGHYAKATDLAPANGLYWLGYAWMLEQGAPFAAELPAKSTGVPKAMSRAGFLKAAGDAYARAFKSTRTKPLETMDGISLVAIEAMDTLNRLAKDGKYKLSAELKADLDVFAKEAEKISIPISPIVFPLNASTPLSAIDNPKAKVKFDLDGSGTVRRWTWITPKAAFLVWNPLGDGKVESGRELFGNATFWMFFQNGYDALGALDDDRDGELKDRELRFIAVWRDANSNGISEPGEVRPLEAYGITAIRTRADGRKGPVWFRKAGLIRKDGSVLPTYDWLGKRVK
jgi:hypothetical protein